MRVVCDIECDGLKPKHIWVIVCLDIDNNTSYVFRNLTLDVAEKERFLVFAGQVGQWIGHNFLEYDYPAMRDLLGLRLDLGTCTDTLIISRLVDYSRKDGHSLEQYGVEFNLPKGTFNDWAKYSVEMEEYCVRDTRICSLIYQHYLHIIVDSAWQQAIRTEHEFQMVVNALHNNGFGFNTDRARDLLSQVQEELGQLDREIETAFPPRLKLIREIHPKETKYGTLSLVDFKWCANGDLSTYNGGPFSRCKWVTFNPASPKQVVSALNEAGWNPIAKTKTHIELERELNHVRWQIKDPKLLDLELKRLDNRLQSNRRFGWKISEQNLETLPPDAPEPARLLARRILVESRRRTLVEWLSLVGPDNRIRGRYYGIGCWTGRMAHQRPNTANIPNAVKISDGSTRYLGKELRELWCVPKKRLLVGVDAESIQFRVFAHLINDKELIHAIEHGTKKDKTDPHSINQVVFGKNCKTRNASKHSMFAIFFGGRANKIKNIMGCTKDQAEEAIGFLLKRYPGLKRMEDEIFPQDARRGYFIGLDGRQVRIPSNTESGRRHLCMSGYLQAGEAVIMKMATIKWCRKLCPEIFK